MVKVRVRAMDRVRIRVTVGVIDGVCGAVRKKVLAILFSSSIGIGIGIGNTFHKYSLPANIRLCDTTATFKRHLKTHLFTQT